MKEEESTMRFSLEQCEARLDELDRALMDPSIVTNPQRLREITTERAHLEPMVQLWRDLDRARQELEETKELMSDPEIREDPEMREITELEQAGAKTGQQLFKDKQKLAIAELIRVSDYRKIT